MEQRSEQLDLVAPRPELELPAAVERDPFARAGVVEVEEALHRSEARRLAVEAPRAERQRLDVAPLVDRRVPGDPVTVRLERAHRLRRQRGVLDPRFGERRGNARVELRVRWPAERAAVDALEVNRLDVAERRD